MGPEAAAAIKTLAGMARERAFTLIYKVVRTDEWYQVLSLVGSLDDDDIRAERSSRTMSLLLTSLQRRSAELERAGQVDRAAEVRGFVATLSTPEAARAATAP